MADEDGNADVAGTSVTVHDEFGWSKRQQKRQQKLQSRHAAEPVHSKAPDPLHFSTDAVAPESCIQSETPATSGDPVRGDWYEKSIAYWQRVPATNDGVLGGFINVASSDIVESGLFLAALAEQGLARGGGGSRAIDCAAGVGRVTSGLLMHRYEVVDVLEPLPHFLAEARRRLSSKPHRGQFFEIGLQDFRPSPNTYDLVWVQWAIGHVTDEDLVPLLARLKACLTPAGVIILKENVLTGNGGNSTLVDLGGCSVRRSNSHFKALFGRGGCRVVKEDAQKQLPSDLCRVKMWALR